MTGDGHAAFYWRVVDGGHGCALPDVGARAKLMGGCGLKREGMGPRLRGDDERKKPKINSRHPRDGGGLSPELSVMKDGKAGGRTRGQSPNRASPNFRLRSN